MRWSLDILYVLLLFRLDTTIRQLCVVDLILAIEAGAGASPVPVQSADVLQTRHLFIGEVSQDLDHVATVAVNAEDIFIYQGLSPDSLL